MDRFTITIGGVAVKCRIGTLSITESINGRNTLTCVILSLDATYRPQVGEEVIVLDADAGGARVFGGNISAPSEHAIDDELIDEFASTVTAVDFNAIADRRSVINGAFPGGSFTLKMAATSLLGYISGDGVTLDPAQVDGPILPLMGYDVKRVSGWFDELSVITGFIWEIDYNKVLRFIEPASTAAPFDIADDDGNTVGDITVEPSDVDYANRVIVLAGTGQREVTEALTFNGSDDFIDLTYTLVGHAGYLTVNGIFETLGGSPAIWVFDSVIPNRIKREAGAPAAGVGSITYTAQFPYIAQADDVGEQGGPRGIVDAVIRRTDVFEAELAEAIADGYLARMVVEPRTIRYASHASGLHPGQAQHIQSSVRDIDLDAFITEVRARDVNGETMRYDVTAVEGDVYTGSWRDTYREWGGIDSGASSAGSAPITIISSGGVGGTGTIGKIPKWTTTASLTDSVISEPNGIVVSIPDGTGDNVYALSATNLEATGGRNFGLFIKGGSNSADSTFFLRNFGNVDLLRVAGNGFVDVTPVSGVTQLARFFRSSNAMVNATVSNQDTGASAYAAVVVGAHGNSWAMRMGGSGVGTSNALEFAVDALGSPIARLTMTTLGNVTFNTTGGVTSTLSGGTNAMYHVVTGSAGSMYFGLDNSTATIFGTGNSSGILYSNSSGGLAITATAGTLRLAAGGITEQVRLTTAGTLQTPNYASQTTGWGVTSAGAADFRYLFVDEMHAKSFIADLEQALAGGQIIAKSVAMVSQAFTAPAAGGATTLWIRDLPSAANMAAFESGDFVVLRTFSRAAGALTIADCVGVVTSYADGSGANEGQQSWTFTRSSGGSAGTMSSSTVVAVDSIVIDYGVSGNGYYEVNAIDGIYGVNSPYAQVVTWATAPVAANRTVRARFGNIKGITSVTEYGFFAGNFSGNAFVRFTDQNAEIRGIPLKLYDGGTETMRLDASVPSFAVGSTLPSAYGTGTGIWMGKDSGAYKFRVGNPAGVQMTWNGTALVIGAFTVGATALTGGSGFTLDTAGLISLSSGSSSFWASTVGGAPHRIWIGDSTSSTNIWYVDANGAMFAENGLMCGTGFGIQLSETGSTPSTPTAGTRVNLYMKADKLVVQYNLGGTAQYFWLDLTSGSGTWAFSTSAP